MSFHIRSLLLVVVLAIGAMPTLAAQPPITIVIAQSSDGITAGSGVRKSGSSIHVLVALTNNSAKTVSIPSMDLENYTIDVRDERANQVAEAAQAVREREAKNSPTNLLRGRKTFSGVIGDLKPGETARQTIEVSYRWDMSRPGKYSIQLTRKLPEELGPGVVKSNTITVTVTP
jgi:hypothetical protein